MKTTIYFIRHSKKNYEWKGDDFSRPLTEEGLRLAGELSNIPELNKADIIYSSPYIRSIDTITPLANKLGVKIQVMNELSERKLGPGMPSSDSFIKNQFEDYYYKMPNGESLMDTQARNLKAVEQIIGQNPGKTIIVSTHAIALSTIINHYQSSFDYKGYLSIGSPDIWKLDFEDLKCVGIEHIPLNFK